jgi:hypothetical protein
MTWKPNAKPVTWQNMNKADRKRFDDFRHVGCVVCGNSAFEVHHIRHSGKRDNKKTIPLCFLHHRGGGHGLAIHDGLRTWELTHGLESYHLEYVNSVIKETP